MVFGISGNKGIIFKIYVFPLQNDLPFILTQKTIKNNIVSFGYCYGVWGIIAQYGL